MTITKIENLHIDT